MAAFDVQTLKSDRRHVTRSVGLDRMRVVRVNEIFTASLNTKQTLACAYL